MKFFYLFLNLVFITEVQSQLELKNISLTDPSKDILYLSLDNRIQIVGSRNNKSYSIKSKMNKILKSEFNNLEFIVYPNKEGIDTLSIFENDICVKKVRYEIKKIGYPVVKFCNAKKITPIIELTNCSKLTIEIPNSYYHFLYHIGSFELYKIDGKDTIPLYEPFKKGIFDTIQVFDVYSTEESSRIIERTEEDFKITKGCFLTNYQLTEISKSKSGQKLWFKNIKVMFPSNCIRKLEDLVIQIE